MILTEHAVGQVQLAHILIVAVDVVGQGLCGRSVQVRQVRRFVVHSRFAQLVLVLFDDALVSLSVWKHFPRLDLPEKGFLQQGTGHLQQSNWKIISHQTMENYQNSGKKEKLINDWTLSLSLSSFSFSPSLSPPSPPAHEKSKLPLKVSQRKWNYLIFHLRNKGYKKVLRMTAQVSTWTRFLRCIFFWRHGLQMCVTANSILFGGRQSRLC